MVGENRRQESKQILIDEILPEANKYAAKGVTYEIVKQRSTIWNTLSLGTAGSEVIYVAPVSSGTKDQASILDEFRKGEHRNFRNNMMEAVNNSKSLSDNNGEVFSIANNRTYIKFHISPFWDKITRHNNQA